MIGNIIVLEIFFFILLFEKIDIRKLEFLFLWKYLDVQVFIRGGIVLLNGNFLCMDNKSIYCVFFMEDNYIIIQYGIVFDVELNLWEILLDDGVFYII